MRGTTVKTQLAAAAAIIAIAAPVMAGQREQTRRGNGSESRSGRTEQQGAPVVGHAAPRQERGGELRTDRGVEARPERSGEVRGDRRSEARDDRGRDGRDDRERSRGYVRPNYRDYDRPSYRVYDAPRYRSYGYAPGYRPYVFRPRLRIGFGLFLGYPVPYTYAYSDPVRIYGYGAPGYPVVVGPAQSIYGGVALEITPNDAEVWVDGAYAGIVRDFDGTRQPLTLTAGTHRIELRLGGYVPTVFDVTVQPGEVIPYQGGLQAY